MEEHLNTPRSTPPLQDPLEQDPIGTDPRPETPEMDDRNWPMWPVVVIGLLLIAALLFFSNTGNTPNSQVGNADRPTVTTQPPAKSPTVPQ